MEESLDDNGNKNIFYDLLNLKSDTNNNNYEEFKFNMTLTFNENNFKDYELEINKILNNKAKTNCISKSKNKFKNK